MCGLAKCRKPCVLSDEVYWWLCARKLELRRQGIKCNSIDDVLRHDLPQMSLTIEQQQEKIRLLQRELDEGIKIGDEER